MYDKMFYPMRNCKTSTGYMLSFNFGKNKETGVKRIQVGDKVLFEGTV